MTADSRRTGSSKGDKPRSSSNESKQLTARQIARRMVGTGSLAGVFLLTSLAIGVVGYHVLGGLHWLDALVNASMILGGMGPVDPITKDSGKWFESIYALYSGVVLLGSAGVFFSPLIHRFLHRLHLDTEGGGD
jgi:hypothetical protein